MLRVTQVRSAIGTKPKHRGTLRALGLGRIGRFNILPDRTEIWGMIQRVPHLVEVEEIDADKVDINAYPTERLIADSQVEEIDVEVGVQVVDTPSTDAVATGEVGSEAERTPASDDTEDDPHPHTLLKLHNIAPSAGSKKRARRVARGIAGRGGKTAGRGMKGQRARSKVAAGFEGGQMPLLRRVPKLRGFTNPFRVEYQAINLDTIEASGLDEISPETLLDRGLISKGSLVKVLGRGEISRPLRVQVHAVSKTAEAAIESSGGSVEIIAKPWGDRRPPHGSFNQHTNR